VVCRSPVELTGAAEVAGGDPDGSGTATVTVNPGTGDVCLTIEVTGVEVTEAHIHKALVGVNGPIVVPFDPWDSGCTKVDRTLALDIVLHPESYYINVHNDEFSVLWERCEDSSLADRRRFSARNRSVTGPLGRARLRAVKRDIEVDALIWLQLR
jgi:hypothetical protein